MKTVSIPASTLESILDIIERATGGLYANSKSVKEATALLGQCEYCHTPMVGDRCHCAMCMHIVTHEGFEIAENDEHFG